MPVQVLIPDSVDTQSDFGNPKLTEGTFECDVYAVRTYMSADIPGQSGPTPMFAVDFTVHEVVEQGPIREKNETTDKRPPPGPVLVGEARTWQCNTTEKKNLPRMRDFAQAALRFEPGSSFAEKATLEGKPFSWAKFLNECATAENELAGAKVRVLISRVITQKGYAMYVPTFEVSKRNQVREGSVIDSL